MNTFKLSAVALAVASVGSLAPNAFAGVGGSNDLIVAAVASGSVDAIIAEVEKTESLICPDCIQTVTNLTNDDRQSVRLVAAWWFASRPGLLLTMTDQKIEDLAGDATHVRNAADFLGRIRAYGALPSLATAMHNGSLTVDAKQSIVNAVRFMAHPNGNPILQTAMADTDPTVRASAVVAWRDILGQSSATAVEPSLADSDAGVRAAAAGVTGGMRDANARATLEGLVVNDADSVVRRNAAWALGQIGSASSRAALTTASGDPSPLVSQVAKAALAQLAPN
jgi:hypothetical protein